MPVWASFQPLSYHLYFMTNFVLTNLVSLLRSRINSLFDFFVLSALIHPFSCHSFGIQTPTERIQWYEAKVADRWVCGNAVSYGLGSHYSLPGKLGYHYCLTMLFHTDQLRGHLIHQYEERNHCFSPLQLSKGKTDTSCPFVLILQPRKASKIDSNWLIRRINLYLLIFLPRSSNFLFCMESFVIMFEVKFPE